MDGSVKRITLLMAFFLCLVADASSQNQCYSCNYQVLQSPDITSGPEACYEPFNPSADGIDIVNCTGECDYSIQESPDTFQVIRGCSFINPCLEATSTLEEFTSDIYCCSGSLCNDETITSKPAEPLADNECYLCSYVTDPSTTSGSPGCYEPFDASAVAVQKTQCSNFTSSSCQLTVVKSGEDLVVTRDCHDFEFDCIEGCVESEGSSVCNYCCSPGTVCSKGALSFLSVSLLLSITFVRFVFFM